MHQAIHLANGTGISQSQWKLIQASTCAITYSNLTSLFSTDPCTGNWVHKKIYFKTFFTKEWEVALLKLKATTPLLTLCAGNWKADMTLSTVLSDWSAPSHSVVMAQADVFAILGNKIVKNLKIFVEVDYLRSWGVLCQP